MKKISMRHDTILETDVFALTAKGENELRGAGTSLSPPELELLVRIDGKSAVAELGASMRSLGTSIVREMLRKFYRVKLIDRQPKPESDLLDFGDLFADSAPVAPTRHALTASKKEAAVGTSTLKTQGYYVRIARRAASARTLNEGQTLSVVVIEDDPNLANFLQQYLALEQINPRIAGNRDEIIRELRRAPPPDLVLLDVMLPDANGFDVLLKMRAHPVLKTVPVVMLTAKATRNAVLQGLAGGADGYITKPFEAAVLVKAVRSVLGLSRETEEAGSGSAADAWQRNQDK